MTKSGWVTTLFGWLGCACLYAQSDPVLMRIDGKAVLRSEFEYLYHKNKELVDSDSLSLHEYVDLFVNFKLKVAAAEAAGIDTTAQFRRELDGYRRGLAASYLMDETVAEQVAREAYDRMRSDGRGSRLRIKQLFFYLPQQVAQSNVQAAEQRMDSLYLLLQTGQLAFDDAVARFSDAQEEFFVHRFELPAELEKRLFDLPVGAITAPFFTPQGIHIVKVLERNQLSPFEEMKSDLIRRYGRDKGVKAVVERLKKEYNYTTDAAGIAELLAVGKTEKPLFSLNGKVYTGLMFDRFASARPQSASLLFEKYVEKSILDYEYERLELHYPLFRALMQEYRDGILLFEISNREIWSPVGETVLADFFVRHRSRYRWRPSRYRGIVLHCITVDVAKRARKLLKALPETEWQNALRLLLNADAEQVKGVQGVFAVGENAFVDQQIFK
ncbi:MAG: peptidylprolyl isomerase, partial [Prevotellaceae bacterium]|nr:peptidylprolyl isomerase [Prevotellaceae bacterium]